MKKCNIILSITALVLVFLVALSIFTNNIANTIQLIPQSSKDRTHSITIDINSATHEELMNLPDISSKLANNIVSYRNANGSFSSLEELLLVEGIGPKTLEKISPYISIGG